MLRHLKNTLVFFILCLGCVFKSTASEIYPPLGFSKNNELTVVENKIDNCLSAVFKVPVDVMNRFIATKGKVDEFLISESKNINFDRWRRGPVGDFGTSIKTKLVYLGCDLEEKKLNDIYEKSLISKKSFFTFSSSERIFLLINVDARIIFYKYQGN
jgi:hypothetical protein